MNYSTPGSCVLHYLPEFVQIHVHLILCHPLLLLPSVFSSIRIFSNKSALRFRWPKYWSFSLSTSPSNEYLGLISFRIAWFDILSVQGTLKSLLQLHNLKASVVHQLGHKYQLLKKRNWSFGQGLKTESRQCLKNPQNTLCCNNVIMCLQVSVRWHQCHSSPKQNFAKSLTPHHDLCVCVCVCVCVMWKCMNYKILVTGLRESMITGAL